MSPGRTVCPCKSSDSVREVAQDASASSSPRARIRPSRTAMAPTTFFAPPIVTMWPLRSRRSASLHVWARAGVNQMVANSASLVTWCWGFIWFPRCIGMPISETCRGVHPQERGLLLTEVLPAVRLCAFKVRAVTGIKYITFDLIQPDLQFSLQHENELFAFVSVRTTAPRAWSDTKQVGLHHFVARRQQVHFNACICFQHLAIAGTH